MKSESAFGQRLRLSRRAAGLSLRQLAAAIDHAVSPQAIGQYEQGRMLPGSDTALKLAEALAVPLAYLLSPMHLRLQAVEFRRQSALPARERALVEAAVLEHVDRYVQIEGLLNLPYRPWQPPGAPYAVTGLGDAETAARRVRETWGLGLTPLARLAEEIEQRGIKVLMLDIPILVDGLSCQIPQPDNTPLPVIVASSLKPTQRQRFVLAHELAHMVLAIADPGLAEAACDRFAGAFLVPAEAVHAYLGSRRHAFGYEELNDFAHLFGVEAMTVLDRLADLDVVDDRARRSAARMIRRHEAAGPHIRLPDEQPQRFQRLVLRAFAEGALAEAKAVELLQVDAAELARLMTGAPDIAR